MSEPTAPQHPDRQVGSQLADANARMTLEQVVALAQSGPVRCPGPDLTHDAIFFAGLLAEAGVASVVIARSADQSPQPAGSSVSGITAPDSPDSSRRTLLSRQTDLPHELAMLPDDCCLIAGPMKVWRSGDRLLIALCEPR